MNKTLSFGSLRESEQIGSRAYPSTLSISSRPRAYCWSNSFLFCSFFLRYAASSASSAPAAAGAPGVHADRRTDLDRDTDPHADVHTDGDPDGDADPEVLAGLVRRTAASLTQRLGGRPA